MKTYKKDVDLFLVDGEIEVRQTQDIPNPKYGITKISKIIYQTKQLQGIKPLERSKFIKPVNIMDIYNESKKEFGNARVLGLQSFKAGYNANKSEFTRDQIIEAISMAFLSGRGMLYTIESIIDKIRPIALPESITINDNDEIIEVVW